MKAVRLMCSLLTGILVAVSVSRLDVIAVQSISIDGELFTKTQVRLNTEIYNIAAETFNSWHIVQDYGEPETELAKSYTETVDPLVPLALSINETGMWMDTRYTWSSGIYSKLLAGAGVDMNRLQVSQVNTDTYVVNGLCSYYGCGANCTAGTTSHYHTIGRNDNDSLGPLQILRHYVESNEYIKYRCGEHVLDLMVWEDNVIYFTHNQSTLFMAEGNWNSKHHIYNTCELVALMGTAHNTGTAFLSNAGDAGSLWHSPQAVYDYCEAISTEEAISVLNGYIDDWWVEVQGAQAGGKAFTLLGQSSVSQLNKMLNDIGIDKSKYASSFGHKQYYPFKAMLNYMCLERLYYSGSN